HRARVRTIRLGTHLEYIGSSSRASGVCQDGTREFAGRRPILVGRFSGVAEKLSRSSDNDVGARREFAGGIRKLAGNTSGDHRRKTVRLTVRMPEAVGLAGLITFSKILAVIPLPPRNPGSSWRLDRLGLQLYRPHPIFRVAFSDNAAGVDSCTTHTRFF
ncbi:hypothetical protein BHM03_00033668, partial [Ensete ventricosum]